MKQRKNGTLGSLFIHTKAILSLNQWQEAEFFPTKGYAERFGWHCTFYPYAPHLKEEGRVWLECETEECRTYERPESQGGAWILANRIKIIRILTQKEVEILNNLRCA